MVAGVTSQAGLNATRNAALDTPTGHEPAQSQHPLMAAKHAQGMRKKRKVATARLVNQNAPTTSLKWMGSAITNVYVRK